MPERPMRKRRDAFERYARRCLYIRTKEGTVTLLQLNTAQQYLHARLEEQLRTSGRVRALILKGRQQGCSTYVEARFFWKVTRQEGVRAFILAHQEDASRAIFEMTRRFLDHCPEDERLVTKVSNARTLRFEALDSGCEVGTAGSRGAGRGKTLQYLHGSEVAYWPRAETHLAGALQAVPNARGTEVILESTSAGPRGMFHAMCRAAQAGKSPYQLIFIPWYWQLEYRTQTADFVPTDDECAYAERFGLEAAQLAWRRAKIAELGGPGEFRREYPSDIEEAFTADAVGALWRRDEVRAGRVYAAPALPRVVVGVDPAASTGETGIVVAGRDENGHGYVLADCSCAGAPHLWAQQAVAAYHTFRADYVVAEANNGGEMVAYTIHTIDPRVPVSLVHASRGKQARAQPVAALYAQGRVHHVGTFDALEDQMCSFTPDMVESPDRVDALVWAITALMEAMTPPPPDGSRFSAPRRM